MPESGRTAATAKVSYPAPQQQQQQGSSSSTSTRTQEDPILRFLRTHQNVNFKVKNNDTFDASCRLNFLLSVEPRPRRARKTTTRKNSTEGDGYIERTSYLLTGRSILAGDLDL